jgi:hypothetical protein
MTFHPTEPWVAVNSLRGGFISIVNCITGAILDDLAIEEEVFGIEFDKSGVHLMAITAKSVVVWDMAVKPVVRHIDSHSCRFYEDDRAPMMRSETYGIWILFADQWQFWDISKPIMLRSMPAPAGERLLRAAASGTGEFVAVTYDEGFGSHQSMTLSKWSITNNQLIHAIPFGQWHLVEVSHDASVAVAIPGDRSSTDIWNLDRGNRLDTIVDLRSMTDCDFAADNRHVVTRALHQIESLWTLLTVTDVLSGETRILDPHVPFEPQFSCSPYEGIVATVVNDHRHSIDMTAFWDCHSGQQIGSTSGHVGIAVRQFSPCGKWFASISNSSGAETSLEQLPGGTVSITQLKWNRSRT